MKGSGTWSLSQTFCDELDKVQLEAEDVKAIVTWQPTEEKVVSIVGLIRGLLERESRGLMAPIGYELRQLLLSLIDFALGEFQGLPYHEAMSRGSEGDKRKVADVMALSGDQYVGVQYGKGGVIERASRNPGFLEEMVTLTAESTKGWQYVPLQEFQTLVRWALEPEREILKGIDWRGRPLFTRNLYRVARWGKTQLYVGMRGGKAALEGMSTEEIRGRQSWELSTERKSRQWFSGEDFCQVLEAHGITYD